VTVQVGSQVSGNIKELHADFNTKVKIGQLVALIDPELFEAKLRQSQANVESAKAAVVSAQAGVQRAQADRAGAAANLQNLKADIAKAKVAVDDAKNKLDRRIDLFKQGILSAEERDTFQATYDAAIASQQGAEAQYKAGEESLKASDSQVEVAKTTLSSAQAQVKQVIAELSQAQTDLAHTRITAPVDGTVVARNMDVGQTVAASFTAPTIFQIAQDLTKMQVDTNVDESDVGKVQVGQPATFTVDAYPTRTFRASVVQIRKAPINVQNVITYDVVIGFDNSDLKIFPGMTANVRIVTDRREEALKIPNSALRVRLPDAEPARPAATKGGGAGQGGGQGRRRAQEQTATVYTLDANGQPKPIKVKLGISDGQSTEVTGAVHEGEAIITSVVQKNAPPVPQQQPRGGGLRL